MRSIGCLKCVMVCVTRVCKVCGGRGRSVWLNKKIRKKLILIWDNASSHKSQTIKDYLDAQDDGMPKIWMEKKEIVETP